MWQIYKNITLWECNFVTAQCSTFYITVFSVDLLLINRTAVPALFWRNCKICRKNDGQETPVGDWRKEKWLLYLIVWTGKWLTGAPPTCAPVWGKSRLIALYGHYVISDSCGMSNYDVIMGKPGYINVHPFRIWLFVRADRYQTVIGPLSLFKERSFERIFFTTDLSSYKKQKI